MKTLIKIIAKHDNSGKSFVGNKPYYFLNKDTMEISEHMTYKQACLFVKNLKKLGIYVLPTIDILGI